MHCYIPVKLSSRSIVSHPRDFKMMSLENLRYVGVRLLAAVQQSIKL